MISSRAMWFGRGPDIAEFGVDSNLFVENPVMRRLFFLPVVVAACLLLPFAAPAAGKKVLYVDSYHADYIWSADILRGVKNVLESRRDIDLRVFYMDTKRNKSVDEAIAAALAAKNIIEEWQPDVVIAADDNASRYLIAPFYKFSPLPFVFCGLNWDADLYGFPLPNVTGMLEVALYEDTMEALRGLARGERIGYLASDTESERKELDNIRKRFGSDFTVRLVTTFTDLQAAFVELQQSCDMLILQECRSVEGFDHAAMMRFIEEQTQIPSAAMQKYLMHYALITFAKVGEEQGEWAARTALAILGGKAPGMIPLAENRQARIFLNMEVAHRLNLKFPRELLDGATFTSEVPPE